jgi:hypothetical protein
VKEQEARHRRRWRDWSRGEKAALVVASLAQFSLAAAAWADLARRPQGEVRGPKWRWALLIGVNFIGPIAYFRYGRVHPLGTADR